MSKAVPLDPPPPTAKAVLSHRRVLETELDVLKATVPAFALASARGEAGPRDALEALHRKILAVEFEIDSNHQAAELASQQDAAGEAAWRTAIQNLEPQDILVGFGKDSCCRRCAPGLPGGCVITGSVPFVGGACCHPLKEKHLFHRDGNGLRIFPYRDAPQASRVFDTACDKLNVRKEFV